MEAVAYFSGEEMQWRIYSSDRQIYLESTVSWNKLYHRDLFKDILFPEGKLHEDEALSYRLYAKADAYCRITLCFVLVLSESNWDYGQGK